MTKSTRRYRPRRPSLIWPILLIGAGVVFLLANLDLLPSNAWMLIARLWPVVLVLLGLEILIGRRSTIGMILSGFLSLAIVGGLIVLLLSAPNIPALNQLTSPWELQRESIQAPLEDVERAIVSFDWKRGAYSLDALSPNSPDIISGYVEYFGTLRFDARTYGSRGDINLDSHFPFGMEFSFVYRETNWDISLHPNVLYDLTLNSGSGVYEFDLGELRFRRLKLDSSSGSVQLTLPPGDYTAEIDGGSGRLNLMLPEAAAVQVIIDSGSGRFDPGSSLQLIRGDRDGDGTWETPNFSGSTQHITLEIDQSSGQISIKTK